MEIRNYSTYNEKEILKVYSSVGWTAYTDDPQALKQGFQNSLLVLAAYEREELLGIIRAVGDGVTIVFIQDLLVFPETAKVSGRLWLRQFLSVIRPFVKSS